jgi:hypothetical protein
VEGRPRGRPRIQPVLGGPPSQSGQRQHVQAGQRPGCRAEGDFGNPLLSDFEHLLSRS